MTELLTKNESGRIEWIDALKGFTIILVVFSHVELASLGLKISQSDLNSFLITFRMPLFFFLSGFVAYRAGKKWTNKQFFSDIKKKLRVQLLPMLFFGIIYTLVKSLTIESFFVDPQKHGYWFTLVLLEMFIPYFLISYICHNKAKKPWIEDIVLFIIAGVLCILNCFVGDSILNRLLSGGYFMGHFLFFVVGHLCSKYSSIFSAAIDNKYIMAFSIIGWVGCYFLTSLNWSENFFPRSIHFLINLLTSFLGVVVVVSFFVKNSEMFSLETVKGRALQYIGRRTLDVYLIHYFLLPHIPGLGSFFLQNQHNIVIEGTVVFVISLLVVAFCILVSNIIRLSPFLAHWLFGVKHIDKQVIAKL